MQTWLEIAQSPDFQAWATPPPTDPWTLQLKRTLASVHARHSGGSMPANSRLTVEVECDRVHQVRQDFTPVLIRED